MYVCMINSYDYLQMQAPLDHQILIYGHKPLSEWIMVDAINVNI